MTASYAVGMLALCAFCHLLIAGLTYARTRGTRVVRCPVKRTEASVTRDALRGALLLTRPEDIKIRRCSLWPEHRECYQWCRDELNDDHDASGRP